MNRAQLMTKKTVSMLITGVGKTEEESFGKALETMRKQIYKEVDGMILKMEPLEVYLESVEAKEEVEKFLFFFMPRTKYTYKMTFTFIVEISFIDTRSLRSA